MSLLVDALEPEHRVLTDDAKALLLRLHRQFEARRQELLAQRGTQRPGFRDDTHEIRNSDWQVAAIPEALLDRRVEITGPVDRKMMINALNSGAQVFMADFEDSHSPTWEATLQGHINVRDAVARRLTFTAGDKQYDVGPDPALLVVRVRGLHLDEANVPVEGLEGRATEAPAGRPETHAAPEAAGDGPDQNAGGPEASPTGGGRLSAGLFDAAMTLLHAGPAQARAGTGPYLYIPKIESMEEAAWWDAALNAIEHEVGLPIGSTKVTVLIETLPAVFQMHEILHALRERVVGLNAGRWDYIFSCIKTFRDDPDRVLPDRGQVTMTVPFMRAYTKLLVATCHHRGAFAMGGMSAFIPDRRDEDRNAKAFAEVRADKKREAEDGFDGTWVAHPGLVEVAREPFDAVLGERLNQLDVQRDADVDEHDLLDFTIADGTRTLQGLRRNVDIGIRYLAAWLGGRGAVAIHGLMEDAATAEISRSQVWQWVRHGVELEDGEQVTRPLVQGLIDSTVDGLIEEVLQAEASPRRSAGLRPAPESTDGPGSDPTDDIRRAGALFAEVSLADHFPPFLTLPAYDRLESRRPAGGPPGQER